MLFFKTKEKENEIWHLGPWNDLGVRKKCPWPEPGTEEAAAVRFPASELAGGEGEVGERLEEIESYSEVVFSRSGAAGRGVGGGAARPAAVASCGDGCSASRLIDANCKFR